MDDLQQKIDPGLGDASPNRQLSFHRARLLLAIAGGLLSGFRALLWVMGESKGRDIDQIWYAARALFAGRNPYAEAAPRSPVLPCSR